jgi:two-component sensor histidine kinase
MFTDIGERIRIEKVQTFLAKRGWTESGEDFFRSLSRFLAEILEADYVCIDYLEGDGLSARTVAVYFDGHFEDNVNYALKDTPCGSVVGKTICCFPRAVRDLFPQDAVLQEMGAESYAGITLWSGDNRPIGLIAVIARKPLENPEFVQTVMGLVATRAAGELERRDSAQALHRLVEQKETLLKELQHRVKNNLNVISSLLDLETQGMEEGKTKAIFVGARNRIQSMSAIYERLYLSEDLVRVELGSYIQDLAHSIFESYNIHPGAVSLVIKVDEVRLDTKRVVPLGLIINELISNTLKYAFTPGKGGELSITLSLVGTRLILRVHDNGAGFPKGIDPRTTESLGFVLVRMLSDEIGADLSFENTSGVTVSLGFDI